MMTLKDINLVGSLHNIHNYKTDPGIPELLRAQPDEICLACRAALSEHVKSSSAGERADKGAKTTSNTNSFRVIKQRRNRNFRECFKWVEVNLHKVAKM